jgi:hypothetical protein
MDDENGDRMIVRRDGADWLLISQPDHAGLAGRVMEGWRADGFPERPTRARVLRATRDHDMGWREEDAAPRVSPAGDPVDFVAAPLDVRQGVWPRALDTLAPEDPYVAALVAQHAITVYRRFSGDPAWRGFFTRLEARRDDLVAQAMTEPAAGPGTEPVAFGSFLLDYTMVGLGDLLSLIFCNGWPEPYLIERYQAILRDNRLTISPDPFDGATIALDVVARRIPARPYASDQDLRDTFARAASQHLTGVAVGAPLSPIT